MVNHPGRDSKDIYKILNRNIPRVFLGGQDHPVNDSQDVYSILKHEVFPHVLLERQHQSLVDHRVSYTQKWYRSGKISIRQETTLTANE